MAGGCIDTVVLPLQSLSTGSMVNATCGKVKEYSANAGKTVDVLSVIVCRPHFPYKIHDIKSCIALMPWDSYAVKWYYQWIIYRGSGVEVACLAGRGQGLRDGVQH
jgi:hypothetical protein